MGFFRDIARDARLPIVPASGPANLMPGEYMGSAEGSERRDSLPAQSAAEPMQSVKSRSLQQRSSRDSGSENHVEIPLKSEAAAAEFLQRKSGSRANAKGEHRPQDSGSHAVEASSDQEAARIPAPEASDFTESFQPETPTPVTKEAATDLAEPVKKRAWKTAYVIDTEVERAVAVTTASSGSKPKSWGTPSGDLLLASQPEPGVKMTFPSGKDPDDFDNGDSTQPAQMADPISTEEFAEDAEVRQQGEVTEHLQVIRTPEATMRVRSVSQTTPVQHSPEKDADPVVATVKQADKWLTEERQSPVASKTKREDHATQGARVQIGRIDVVIEAPEQQKPAIKAERTDSNGFASRHYLRKI